MMSHANMPRIVSMADSTMDRGEVEAILRGNPVACKLPPAELSRLLSLARVARYPCGEQAIITAGEAARHYFIVLEGQVVVRHCTRGGHAFDLARLGPGESFGEAALFGSGLRTASVVTAGPCRLLLIDVGALRVDAREASWALPVVTGLTRSIGEHLRHTNTMAVAALEREAGETRRRLAMGHFLMWIIVGMSLYTISLGATLSVTDNLALASMCTNSVILISVFAMYRLVSQSPYPRSTFGLVLNPGWRKEVLQALVWSAGLMALATLGKWLLIVSVPALSAVPLFDSAWLGVRPLTTAEIAFTATYFLMSPLQEMIARGCLQSSLTVFLEKRPRHVLQAIVLSNLIFAANHAHLSPWFALLAFAPGLAWGALYHRQRSLLGVAISHAIVGTYALKLLGLDLLVRM